MNVLPHLQALLWEAQFAYNESRYADAAVGFEQAYAITGQQGALEQMFEYGCMASVAWDLAGKWDRALELLLTILKNPPAKAPPPAIYRAHECAFSILMTRKPSPEQIQHRLEKLAQMAN